MASNAVLQEQRARAPASVSRAQLAIDHASQSRPRVATESEDVGMVIDLGLRAGVRVHFKPDHRSEFPKGIIALVDALKEMEALEANWDSYGGMPLSDTAVLPAMQLALASLHRCREPSLVLRPNGGIGLRWAFNNRELEVDIDPNGTCTGFYEDYDLDEELDVSTNVDEVVPLVHQVCRMD